MLGPEAPIAGPQGIAALPATCGELVQGALDGVPCLVSCPIAWFAVARVYLLPAGCWEVPAAAPKAAAALRAALAIPGALGAGARLELQGGIPRGRGYGSSTADVGATLFAAAAARGRSLGAAEVAAGAVAIEPSDSTMFPGLALFDHRRGRFHERLGPAPRLQVMVIDPGGSVDTIAFNRRDLRCEFRRLAGEHREAFALLRDGLARGDLAMVGAAASLSARAHQAILYNPLLEAAFELARQTGALGVCRAHSGTLLGLLLPGEGIDAMDIGRAVRKRLEGRARVAVYPLVGGGPHFGVEARPGPAPGDAVESAPPGRA